MNFRNETIFSFLFKNGVPITNYVIIGFCFYFRMPIVMILFMIGFFVFQLATAYRIYRLGKLAFEEIKDEPYLFCKNIPVFIKGDVTAYKSFFSIDLTQTRYQFEDADILLISQGLILCGKIKIWGNTMYDAPIEITYGKNSTSIRSAQLLSWSESNNGIIVDIHDSALKHNISIRFKERTSDIKKWLSNICEADTSLSGLSVLHHSV